MDLSSLTTLIRELHDFKLLKAALLNPDTRRTQLLVLEPARPYLIAALSEELCLPILVITAQPERARRLYEQIQVWCSGLTPLFFFQENEFSLDDSSFDDLAVVIDRLQTLFALYRCESHSGGKSPLVVCSAFAASGRTLSRDDFAALTHDLIVGLNVEPDRLVQQWQSMGYEMENMVEIPGSMSRRGGIVDVFPPSSELPARIEFIGNKIESIRLFQPKTQRSSKLITSITIIPARESKQGSIAGSLLDYLPMSALLVTDDVGEMQIVIEKRREELEEVQQIQGEQFSTLSRSSVHFLPWVNFESRLDEFSSHVTLSTWNFPIPNDSCLSDLSLVPVHSYSGRLGDFIEGMQAMVEINSRVIIVSQQTQRLAELLQEKNIIVQPVAEICEVPFPRSVTLVQGSLAEGWAIRDILSLFSDKEIFGVVKERRLSRKRPVRYHNLLSGLQYGDYVVHVEHGIARFSGLEKMSVEGVERDYIILEYDAADKLYVPTDQVDRVSRYIGTDEKHPKLSRLGTQEWVRIKQRIKEVVAKMAEELLNLYAAREVTQGFSFSPDNLWQQELESSFPYMETTDQIQAVGVVKADMERSKPMDRLVCGDVGYGKTEVALRAAFKAVMDSKQVVLLVPTTVLAQQHLTTFRGRLQAFPVRVEMLSRFCTEKEQTAVIEDLATGKVDICIGTHRLLQKDVKFKDLGLVIIDEEQRFGVVHKDYFKKLRQEVDVLTLSATPIPRTLHMSLVDIRDMSTMETPPEERLPIKTYVGFYDDRLVREAMLREIERNGQIFYVHNRVWSMHSTVEKLTRLVPEAKICMAHGQMDEKKLADVMSEFSNRKTDVLVATTIIESGLDMPNVNTLIIDQADKLGLAQLYQLRGRVGRGSNHAYAFFLFDRENSLTPEARKRLRTISEATELGAGFGIAMRDLEIRGAGNLLGIDQSGHIASIGFDLYCQLLSEAVRQIKQEREGRSIIRQILPIIPAVNLPLNAYIPEDYVSEAGTRIFFYQRLINIRNRNQINEIVQELGDRFGRLPEPVIKLLYIIEIRLLATEVLISSINTESNNLVLYFNDVRVLDNATFLKEYGDAVKVGKRQLRIDCNSLGIYWQDVLLEVLKKLTSCLDTSLEHDVVVGG